MFVYKIWYIVTAVAVAVAFGLILTGVIRRDYLIRYTSLIAIYFAYLIITSLWAIYPSTTLFWATFELIFIAVFALFYLLGRNNSPQAITGMFVFTGILMFPVAVLLQIMDPSLIRIGQRAVVISAHSLPFCWLYTFRRNKIVGLFSLAIIGVFILLSRSRAPLGVAAVTGLLCFLFFSKGLLRAFSHALMAATLAMTIFVSLLLMDVTRPLILKTIARITLDEVEFMGDYVPSSIHGDIERWTVLATAGELYWSNPRYQLIGMGYMNYMTYSEQNLDRWAVNSLHNIYQTWALEGGLPCLLIVLYILLKAFRILIASNRATGDRGEALYYRALAICLVGILFLGYFHQAHQRPMLYAVLGLIYACSPNHKQIKGE